jgi:hypothetical protein
MPDQLDRIGQRLGNYQLIRLLGQGGFAEVYPGEHLHLKTQAAVKLLHIFGLAWSPDGSRIVTGGYNKIGQVWSAK